MFGTIQYDFVAILGITDMFQLLNDSKMYKLYLHENVFGYIFPKFFPL